MNAFKNSPSGYVRKAPQGYFYFLPHPLPPTLDVNDMEFMYLATEAANILGQLSGLGYSLPNPDFLVIPYIRLEAVASSRIEGTQASLSELFYFEAASEKSVPRMDVLEVVNYVNALNYGVKRLKTLPLSLRLVRELHERLMNNVRGGTPDMTPGQFRRSQNWIGSAGATLNDATYIPPHHTELMELLGNWELFLHSNSRLPILIQCALMHYQFEAIHPFLDGNGRVGRLLISLFLIEKKILPHPLLYLSAFFEQNQSEYYECLLRVSQKGDWRGWLEFFLRAIITQSQNAIESARRILDERERCRQIVQQHKIIRAFVAIVDFMFIHPYFTIQQVVNATGISFNSVRKALDELEMLSMVEEITGKNRNRIYVARQLLNLIAINEPLYKPTNGNGE